MEKDDIKLPPLPEARIVSYQTDSTMRRMELRTYSDKDMKDYACTAIEPYKQRIAELEAELQELQRQWVEHDTLGCPTAKTGIYAIEADRQGRMPSDGMDDVLNDALSNLQHDNYELSYQGYKNRQADIELIRALLSRYSNGQPASCDCSDKSQCWEPCGDLGHDAEHAKLSSGQPAASAKPDDMPPLDDRATYPASMIRRLIREDRARRAAPVAQAPVAWVSKTIAYSKYISDARYRKLRPAVQRWYEPYKCASCAAPVAAPAQPVVNQQMTTDAALADTQRQIIEARALAGELEKLVLEVANSERKPQKLPLEPIVRAYQVLRKLAGAQQ